MCHHVTGTIINVIFLWDSYLGISIGYLTRIIVCKINVLCYVYPLFLDNFNIRFITMLQLIFLKIKHTRKKHLMHIHGFYHADMNVY